MQSNIEKVGRVLGLAVRPLSLPDIARQAGLDERSTALALTGMRHTALIRIANGGATIRYEATADLRERVKGK